MKLLLSITLALSIPWAMANTLSAGESLLAETFKEATKRREGIMKEAAEALAITHDALAYMENNDKKKALTALQEATGKLEILMARDKSLKLAPVSVRVQRAELVSSAKRVDEIKEAAQEALDNDNLQEARELLTGLKSETEITVTSLPLMSYPAAMKQAASEIENGNMDKAKVTLASALSAVAQEEVIYPIPVAKAEYFIEEAQRVSKKNPVDDEAVKVFAKAAKEELNLAEALGYGMEEEMKSIVTKIDELQKDPLKKPSFYQDLKEEFANLGPRSSVTRQAQEAE